MFFSSSSKQWKSLESNVVLDPIDFHCMDENNQNILQNIFYGPQNKVSHTGLDVNDDRIWIFGCTFISLSRDLNKFHAKQYCTTRPTHLFTFTNILWRSFLSLKTSSFLQSSRPVVLPSLNYQLTAFIQALPFDRTPMHLISGFWRECRRLTSSRLCTDMHVMGFVLPRISKALKAVVFFHKAYGG